MAKILSIELGQSIVRVCETDYKSKKPKVYEMFEIASPDGCVEDGFVVDSEGLAQVLTTAIKEKGIKTKKAVFSIASTKIANREAVLPFVKANKLDALVQASAGDYFPVAIADSKITYQILDTPVAEDTNKKYRLSLLVAPNELLESYYTLAKACGLEIAALDYAANSIYEITGNVLSEGVQMVVKFDERITQLFVYDNGTIAMQRMVPTGMDIMVDTLIDGMEKLGKTITFEQAVSILREQPVLRTGMSEEQENCGEIPYELCQAVAESLGMLPASILRVIDFYNSKNKERAIESIFLTGFAENFISLDEMLSASLGTSVQRFSTRAVQESWYKGDNTGSFIACIGAAKAPLDFIPDAHQSKKGPKKKADVSTADAKPDDKYITYGAIVAVVGTVAAIILVAVSLVPYFNAKKENEQLLKREAELVAIEEVYKDKIRSELVLSEVQNMYGMTEFQNDNLSAFFEELEEKLPSNVNVLSFSATEASVSINMNVSSKEAVALVIQEFREFACLDTITVTSLAEEVDELGLQSVVNFTIDCTYAPVIHETLSEENVVVAE